MSYNADISILFHQKSKDTMTILKTKGHTFPEFKEADAMFTSDIAPPWHDGKCCHRCRVEFSLTQRKHHCRNCGQIFCGQCSTKSSTLPKFGIEKEVNFIVFYPHHSSFFRVIFLINNKIIFISIRFVYVTLALQFFKNQIPILANVLKVQVTYQLNI